LGKIILAICSALIAIAHNGYWHSRELHDVCLIYSSYHAFLNPIKRAEAKCETSQQHFQEVTEPGLAHSRSVRQSYWLSGYGCYLVFLEVKSCQKTRIALEFFRQYQHETAALVPLELEPDSQEEEVFDYKQWVDYWLDQEKRGVKFPVDFDIGWKMAGYSTKGKAKEQLTKNSRLVKGRHYVIKKGNFYRSVKSEFSGASGDSIFLTTDAFKHFCQQARTPEGEAIRQYFIEVEKEWREIKNLSTSDRDRELELAQVELEKLKLEKEKSLGELEKKKEILQLDKDKSLAELELQKEIAQIELEKQKQITEVEKRKTHSKHIDDLCYQYNLLDTRGRPDLVKYNAFRRRVFGYLPQIAEYINDEFSISSNNSNHSN
jgi:hypothetical protein